MLNNRLYIDDEKIFITSKVTSEMKDPYDSHIDVRKNFYNFKSQTQCQVDIDDEKKFEVHL
jgi:hypothetical protein